MSRILRIAFLQALLVGVAAPILAAPGPITYAYSSANYLHIGRTLDIPIAGGPIMCPPGGTAMTGCVGGQKPSMTPTPQLGTVLAMGSSPATFTLAASQGMLIPTPSVVAFPNNSMVIQLFTSIGAYGPKAANVTDVNTMGGFGSGFTRVMHPNAWMDQNRRLASNFNWCPNFGGNPNCLNKSQGGSRPIRISYTAGANAFGGTAAAVGSGTGGLATTIGTNPAFPGIPLVISAPLTVQSMTGAVDGRYYSATSILSLMAGPVFLGFGTSPPCTGSLPPAPAGCGQITSLGPVVGTVPPTSNYNYGFPLTTGTVVLSNSGLPTFTTLSATGTDSRTALGRGTITLVAGGAIHAVPSAAGANTRQTNRMSVIVYTLTDPPASPSMGPMGLATAATLVLLGAGFVFRRRL